MDLVSRVLVPKSLHKLVIESFSLHNNITYLAASESLGLTPMVKQVWAHWCRGHRQMEIWLVAFHDVEQGELADTHNIFALLHNLQEAKQLAASPYILLITGLNTKLTLSSQFRPLSWFTNNRLFKMRLHLRT